MNSIRLEEKRKIMFRRVVATVVFVQDLAKCQLFYRDTLGLHMTDSGSDFANFTMDNVQVHLLVVSAAEDLVGEQINTLKIGGGLRGLLAVHVEDVDAAFEALTARGVSFLRPPTDQPWGLRTAHFADPEGNLWEIHQPLAG
jgi:lactoylglutathione lyase